MTTMVSISTSRREDESDGKLVCDSSVYNRQRISSLICSVSRKADQIQRQCPLFSVSNMAIKGYLETILLEPNNGLLIDEGNSNSLPLQ